MSGHSKWSQIKRAKAVTDLKKGQVFSRFAKAISVAAREGGGNPDMNFKLRLIIERAKAAGTPNDNIERAIKRGTGEEKGVVITSALYEGLGPAGSAFLIEVATDNTNRSLGDIRLTLQKNNGRLAESGAVAWMFDQHGLILTTADDRDSATLAAIDAGSLDVQETEDGLEIHTNPVGLMKVKDAIENARAKIITAEIAWVAKQTIELSESDQEKVDKLIDLLESIDDVVAIHTNLS
jgi:YebC/PmpR family DNA-binding regulatory protein